MPGGTALFSNSSSRSQNKNLVEFKAGKMTMKGKMVHPDKRKGLVYIYQSEDSLMHFCWKDRTTGVVEDDLIIFPDDVEFKKVPQCTTGRVFILKFKTSSRKFFFWIQEAKTDKDDDNCRKVNEVLNNPPLGSQRSGGATPDGDLQNLLSSMSQQQLMQLFGGVSIGGLSNLLGTLNQGGSSKSSSLSAATTTPMSTPMVATPKTPTSPANTTKPFSTPQAPKKSTNGGGATSSSSSTTGSTSQPDPIMLSQLQSYLQNIKQDGGLPSTQQQNIDLSAAVNPDSLQAVLNNPEFVKELQKHLPSVGGDTTTQEQLKSTLQSPQFQQALSMFSTAFQSGQLGPVVSQFEMGPEAVNAANSGNMEEFVKALQSATISQQEGSGESSTKKEEDKNKKKNDDEDMNLD
ncbi:unnamed protein product [Nezara viridula]|uniref:Proteasomal ubiquitin receptor ADRM1 homolog n=1 Tax=Nezara viridula TaxID=85310 RepID=A0A9P0HPB1_NEZVI|nr:unnamed protein product [Nezara viridula]